MMLIFGAHMHVDQHTYVHTHEQALIHTHTHTHVHTTIESHVQWLNLLEFLHIYLFLSAHSLMQRYFY